MKFPIIEKRAIWYSISGFLIIASFVLLGTLGLNLSLQFTGGIQNTYSFTDRPDIETVKNHVIDVARSYNESHDSKVDIGTPIVVTEGSEKMNVRYRIPFGGDQATYLDFNKQLKEDMSSSLSAEEDATFTISPSVGEVLKNQAILATVIAIIAILLYIIFAFKNVPKGYHPLHFGLATILALAHDVIILIGVFVLLGYLINAEIGPFFITALLTVLGYSVNDSIVVFDRIRETLMSFRHPRSVEEVAEVSIWETMARSINTSMTVLITLGSLLFFGSESIRLFVLALCVGVFVGTYSSIFIAAPLWVSMHKASQKKKK